MLKCPHCGGNQFKAVIKRAGAIQLNADGAVILKELDKFSYEVVGCLNPKCKHPLTNADLVSEAPCTQCGTKHNPEDLVDGLCSVCHAMKSRPELSQASTEELIRMLLEAEKRNSTPKSDKIEDKVEKSEATVEKIAEKAEKTAPPVVSEPVADTEPVSEEKAEEEELSPQQKAALTRKANAEKKKAEEEAKAQAAAEEVPAPAEEVAEDVASVEVAVEEVPAEEPAPFEPDFGSVAGLPEGDTFPMPAFSDNPF